MKCHRVFNPITDFEHLKQVCYLLGAENIDLTREALDHCQSIVQLPGDEPLNVSVAESLVLFDRLQKNDRN